MKAGITGPLLKKSLPASLCTQHNNLQRQQPQNHEQLIQYVHLFRTRRKSQNSSEHRKSTSPTQQLYRMSSGRRGTANAFGGTQVLYSH